MSQLTKHTGQLVAARGWTTEKPSVPGWYWWYGGEDTERCICHVEQDDIDIGELNGEWSGPLAPPPDEPAQEYYKVRDVERLLEEHAAIELDEAGLEWYSPDEVSVMRFCKRLLDRLRGGA